MRVYDRRRHKIINQPDFGEDSLRFLYHTTLGRCILKPLVSRPVSQLSSLYYNSAYSRQKIPKFIKQYHINPRDHIEQNFYSFNDFFLRKPKHRPVDRQPKHLIAVADAKLRALPIDDRLKIHIKHTSFTTASLLHNRVLAKSYQGGTCLIYRLTMDDIHHYIYPDDGELVHQYKIPGILHSVQPITGRQHKVFTENYREVSILKTKNFGTIAMIEIGALLAGKICNKKRHKFHRGAIKGHFELGGSAIIVLIPPKCGKIDIDIMQQSHKDIETIVRVGEKIGESNA